jgi:Ca2+-binding EF-hand superfamily protein
MIGDRVFHIYDVNKTGYIESAPFVATSCLFFDPSFETKLRLVFAIFDADNDGLITAQDVRSVLLPIPLSFLVFSRLTPTVELHQRLIPQLRPADSTSG